MSYLLRNRTILLISPNEWGRMRVSKHHYAVELASRGNRVFFLNPPGGTGTGRVDVEAHAEIEGLFLVNYSPFFPTLLRFRFRGLYDFLMNRQIALIRRALGEPVDLVWCFEPNLYSDLRRFRADATLYHVVDQVQYDYQIQVAQSADAVAAVAHPILARFAEVPVEQEFVNHGLGDAFLAIAAERQHAGSYAPGSPVRAGYVGNLFMRHIDRMVFRRIIEANPEVEFHLWGPVRVDESNVSGDDSQGSLEFVSFLNGQPNVHLRGVQPPGQYARELADMDLFLMCYDVRSDPNAGSNSHKLLEYLSTGRVIVANRVSTYQDDPDLIRMVPDDHNEALPELFTSTVAALPEHNRAELQIHRARFALANSYGDQVERIERLIGRVVQSEPVTTLKGL